MIKREVLVSAHRGASARLDDNSLAAFEAAVALGADMIETDVRADDQGTLILAHDEVAPNDPTPVMLDQLIALAAGRIALNLELKQHGLAGPLLEALTPRPEGLLITSFLSEALREIHALDPEVATGLVVQIGHEPFAIADECGARALMATVQMIDEELLEIATAQARPLWVWTVNEPADLEWLVNEPRITGVITDEPELALAIRAAGRGARA